MLVRSLASSCFAAARTMASTTTTTTKVRAAVVQMTATDNKQDNWKKAIYLRRLPLEFAQHLQSVFYSASS